MQHRAGRRPFYDADLGLERQRYEWLKLLTDPRELVEFEADLLASSADTNQLSAAEKVTDNWGGVLEVDQIDGSAEESRRLGNGRKVHGGGKTTNGHIDVGVGPQAILSGRAKDEDLCGAHSAEEVRYGRKQVGID